MSILYLESSVLLGLLQVDVSLSVTFLPNYGLQVVLMATVCWGKGNLLGPKDLKMSCVIMLVFLYSRHVIDPIGSHSFVVEMVRDMVLI